MFATWSPDFTIPRTASYINLIFIGLFEISIFLDPTRRNTGRDIILTSHHETLRILVARAEQLPARTDVLTDSRAFSTEALTVVRTGRTDPSGRAGIEPVFLAYPGDTLTV